MSRPKPNILLEWIDKETYNSEQILESTGIWTVLYDDTPINLKSENLINNDSGPKYKKVSFSNPGHAINLAKRLNVLFKTDKFKVVSMVPDKQVYP